LGGSPCKEAAEIAHLILGPAELAKEDDMKTKRIQISVILAVIIFLFCAVMIYAERSATYCFQKWFGVRMPPFAEASLVRFSRQGEVACFVFKTDQAGLNEVEKTVLPNTSGFPLPLDSGSIYSIVREDALLVDLIKNSKPITVRRGVGGKRESLGVTFVTDRNSIAWVVVIPL